MVAVRMIVVRKGRRSRTMLCMNSGESGAIASKPSIPLRSAKICRKTGPCDHLRSTQPKRRTGTKHRQTRTQETGSGGWVGGWVGRGVRAAFADSPAVEVVGHCRLELGRVVGHVRCAKARAQRYYLPVSSPPAPLAAGSEHRQSTADRWNGTGVLSGRPAVSPFLYIPCRLPVPIYTLPSPRSYIYPAVSPFLILYLLPLPVGVRHPWR